MKDLPDFAELVGKADTSIRSRAWNDKKITAHHAIIPTRIKADFEKLNAVEQNIFLKCPVNALRASRTCRLGINQKNAL